MVSKRNRYITLINFIESCGLEVNIGKNKAQGNKGFFKVKNQKYRIDISKNLEDEELLGVLAHEFAHFVHYQYNNKLNSLNFIFPEYNEELEEELIKITVDSIDKKTIEPLFNQIEVLKKEIQTTEEALITSFSNNKKLPEISLMLEKKIKSSNLKYLLKYDNVKVIENFQEKVYSIDYLSVEKPEECYILHKSKQRALKRLNSRISRLNRYYNSTTELFARAVELFFTNKTKLFKLAPRTYNILENSIKSNKVPFLTNFYIEAEKYII
ncbi:hypothetical protein IJ384_01595 [bacterium]|nr:hypothetical protein [bacterium]